MRNSSAAPAALPVQPGVREMNNTSPPETDEAEGTDAIRRVRRLMAISAATTIAAVALVLVLVGYRLWNAADAVAEAPDTTALLPRGAKVIATAVADGRIVVTIETGGAVEIRSYDLRSLKPAGRLRLVTEP